MNDCLMTQIDKFKLKLKCEYFEIVSGPHMANV